MASNVLTRRGMGYIFYCQSMTNVTKKLLRRAMGMMPPNKAILHCDSTSNGIDSPWPHNPNLPLPGNVGVDFDSLDVADNVEPKHTYQSLAGALLQLENESMRKSQIVNQYISSSENVNEECCVTLNNSNKVECKIESCPPTLKRGFQRLFSEITNPNDDLTVVTISQETENDMAVLSNEIEEEREKLLITFIENAKEIVHRIQECGYWADFIDPSSGQAFHGDYKNETLFETDDRFNQLGFHIEDLGCCKAISHKQWGTYVFVGVIFTNAPVSSHVFSNIYEDGVE